jgi:hypothetical protein
MTTCSRLRFLGFLIIMGIRWSGASQKVNRVLTKVAGTIMILGAALLCGLGGCAAAPIPVDIVVENVAVYSGESVRNFRPIGFPRTKVILDQTVSLSAKGHKQAFKW